MIRRFTVEADGFITGSNISHTPTKDWSVVRGFWCNDSSADVVADLSPGEYEVLPAGAFDALVWLVKEEYPEKYSLAEIAFTWGTPGIMSEQVEALRAATE